MPGWVGPQASSWQQGIFAFSGRLSITSRRLKHAKILAHCQLMMNGLLAAYNNFLHFLEG